MKRLSEAAVAGQIKAKRGNLAAVGRVFGVTRAAVHDYVGKRPALKELVRWSRQEMLDRVEYALFEAAEAGEPWAVLFVLRTQGRDRGYGREPPPSASPAASPVPVLIVEVTAGPAVRPAEPLT